MNSKIINSWSDFLNNDEFSETGKAKLYRNPEENIIIDENGYISSSFKYLRHKDVSRKYEDSNEEVREYLFDQTPIAYGLTAFAVPCEMTFGPTLKSLIKGNTVFDWVEIFDRYTEIVCKLEKAKNMMSVNRKPEAEFMAQFYREFIIQERLNLHLSEKYYADYRTDEEGAVQNKVRGYVNAYIGMIETKLNNALGTGSRISGEQTGTEYKQEGEPKTETTTDKIARILEPLQGAFESDNHINTIASGLAEFAESGICNANPYRLFATYNSINEFYEPFVNVWKATGLTPANIGEVLTRFLYMHNGKREGIAPGTVRKNIYDCKRRLKNRNTP